MHTLKKIIPLQLLAIVFSLSSICVKMVSISWGLEGLFSVRTSLWMAMALFILATYAFFWQKLLVKCPLTVAYLNKSTTILWTLLWAVLLFDERITLFNLLGIGCIFAGVIMVSAHE